MIVASMTKDENGNLKITKRKEQSLEDYMKENHLGQYAKDISYWTFEAEMVRNERIIRRLWILILVLIGALAVTNIIWMMR